MDEARSDLVRNLMIRIVKTPNRVKQSEAHKKMSPSSKGKHRERDCFGSRSKRSIPTRSRNGDSNPARYWSISPDRLPLTTTAAISIATTNEEDASTEEQIQSRRSGAFKWCGDPSWLWKSMFLSVGTSRRPLLNSSESIITTKTTSSARIRAIAAYSRRHTSPFEIRFQRQPPVAGNHHSRKNEDIKDMLSISHRIVSSVVSGNHYSLQKRIDNITSNKNIAATWLTTAVFQESFGSTMHFPCSLKNPAAAAAASLLGPITPLIMPTSSPFFPCFREDGPSVYLVITDHNGPLVVIESTPTPTDQPTDNDQRRYSNVIWHVTISLIPIHTHSRCERSSAIGVFSHGTCRWQLFCSSWPALCIRCERRRDDDGDDDAAKNLVYVTLENRLCCMGINAFRTSEIQTFRFYPIWKYSYSIFHKSISS